MSQPIKKDEGEIRQGRKLDRKEFDDLCRQKKIKNPHISTFGDGYGEPYNPHRVIYGYLDGELVWTET